MIIWYVKWFDVGMGCKYNISYIHYKSIHVFVDNLIYGVLCYSDAIYDIYDIYDLRIGYDSWLVRLTFIDVFWYYSDLILFHICVVVLIWFMTHYEMAWYVRDHIIFSKCKISI